MKGDQLAKTALQGMPSAGTPTGLLYQRDLLGPSQVMTHKKTRQMWRVWFSTLQRLYLLLHYRALPLLTGPNLAI